MPDYYEIIKDPMDLQTLEERVDADLYKNVDDFETDMQKIFDNCKKYNDDSSNYYKCAVKLEKFCKEKLKYLRAEHRL